MGLGVGVPDSEDDREELGVVEADCVPDTVDDREELGVAEADWVAMRVAVGVKDLQKPPGPPTSTRPGPQS